MLYPNNNVARDSIRDWLNMNYRVAESYKIKSMVPLSGGLDSVALLAAMLQHTNHDIHAHHVDIVNAERRSNPENLAVANVLAYLSRNYRPFTFTSSKYEMTLGTPERVGPDVSVVMYMLSRVNYTLGNTTDIIWTAHMKGVLFEYLEASAVLAACHSNYRTKPLWAMPFYNVSKFNLYNAIPPELAELSWSCRTPNYDAQGRAVACEKCHACGAMKAVKLQVSRLKPQQPAVSQETQPQHPLVQTGQITPGPQLSIPPAPDQGSATGTT